MSKVVLITGASSGIGKVSAIYLHSRNYKVYGTSRTPQKVNVPFPIIALDVTKKQTIKNAVEQLIKKEGRIDVLINNAGKGITGPIEDTPTEEMSANFETNFFGVLEVIKEVLPHMRNQKTGLIINITSIAGYMGLPFRGIYSASKGALSLVTEALSMEVKSFGIRVVTIAPGDFATNIASGRYHTPVFDSSAYKEKYTKNLALIDAHVNSGKNPIIVARTIKAIIENKNPKIHYKVGAFMEIFSIVLKRLLPDKVYEKLLMNYYRL